jgi:hypothetical protein
VAQYSNRTTAPAYNNQDFGRVVIFIEVSVMKRGKIVPRVRHFGCCNLSQMVALADLRKITTFSFYLFENSKFELPKHAMSLARIKPNIFQPIHLRPCPSTQFRCLRTKPGRLRPLPPRQGAFGLPESIGERVKKRVENAKKRVKFLKKKDDPTKIPLVPKEPGQKIPVAPREPEKPEWEMTEDEIGRRKQLQEQDKRIAQFEMERKQKREQIETNMQERASGRKIPEPKKQEKADTKVYKRDIIGRKFKKKKVEYKIDLYGPLVRRESNTRWATRNHVRFTNRPENKSRMAQAAAEIIRDYHQHMNGEKLNDMLNGHNTLALQLPEGLVLQDVDPRHLALPFPTRAILPTMRLVFTEMKDQVRFAMSDQQVNSISTGTSHL